MMTIIYAACAAISTFCAVLLLRSYSAGGYRLLFWSGLCFAGLSINNLLVLLDRTIFLTTVDLLTWRLVAALGAMLLLLYGLIMEDK